MSHTIAPLKHDTPEKMAAELRRGCLQDNFIDIEDVDADQIARWLDELVVLRSGA